MGILLAAATIALGIAGADLIRRLLDWLFYELSDLALAAASRGAGGMPIDVNDPALKETGPSM